VLIIRAAQMKVLDLAARLSNLQPYVDHVRQCHPEAAEKIGEVDLPAYLASALTRAFDYGIETTPDYFRFLDLAVLFGLDWSREDLKWMPECLSDQSLPNASARMDKLYLTAMYNLEGATETGTE
jgi:hypothetical protein